MNLLELQRPDDDLLDRVVGQQLRCQSLELLVGQAADPVFSQRDDRIGRDAKVARSRPACWRQPDRSRPAWEGRESMPLPIVVRDTTQRRQIARPDIRSADSTTGSAQRLNLAGDSLDLAPAKSSPCTKKPRAA